MFGWKTFSGRVEGVHVHGDKDVKPTRWWRHLFLALWGWKTVAVFEVEDPHAATDGYRIGFVPFNGPAKLRERVCVDRCFRMKIGREDCTFFAVDRSGKEIALRVIARTDRNNPTYTDVPLY
jgi:hypothetical protein